MENGSDKLYLSNTWRVNLGIHNSKDKHLIVSSDHRYIQRWHELKKTHTLFIKEYSYWCFTRWDKDLQQIFVLWLVDLTGGTGPHVFVGFNPLLTKQWHLTHAWSKKKNTINWFKRFLRSEISSIFLVSNAVLLYFALPKSNWTALNSHVDWLSFYLDSLSWSNEYIGQYWNNWTKNGPFMIYGRQERMSNMHWTVIYITKIWQLMPYTSKRNLTLLNDFWKLFRNDMPLDLFHQHTSNSTRGPYFFQKIWAREIWRSSVILDQWSTDESRRLKPSWCSRLSM